MQGLYSANIVVFAGRTLVSAAEAVSHYGSWENCAAPGSLGHLPCHGPDARVGQEVLKVLPALGCGTSIRQLHAAYCMKDI